MLWWTLRKLRSKDESKRAGAALSLGVVGDKRAVVPLKAALADTSAVVRRFALQSLAKIDGPDSIDELVPMLQDDDPYVRDSAAMMLIDMLDSRIAEPLAAALKDLSPALVSEAVQELVRIGERGVQLLSEGIKSGPVETASRITDALGEIDSLLIVEPLGIALSRTESSVRLSATKGLAKLGAGRAAEQLLSAYRDDHAAVRLTAIEALLTLPNARLAELCKTAAIGQLVADLRTEDERLRIAVTTALGRIAAAVAVDSLILALKDSSQTVREEAAMALGVIGAERSIDPLAETMADESDRVRGSVRRAIEMIGGEHARSVLASSPPEVALVDERRPVGIDELLSELGRRDILGANPAFAALHEMGPKAVPHLLNVLDSNNVTAVVDAINILQNLDAKEAIPKLTALSGSQWAEVHQAALTALAKLDKKSSASLEFDRHNAFGQIARLWTAIIQGRQELYPAEVLHQWCIDATQAMPGLKFSSNEENARAWGMLGSLVFKSLNPDWPGGFGGTAQCAEAKHCYEEALRCEPGDGWWQDWVTRFS